MIRTLPQTSGWSTWTRFWHTPVRAERLALVRVLLGVAILTDQIFQFLPIFSELYGPGGFYPAGLQDGWMLRSWRWTFLFFYTDDLTIVSILFGVWMAITVAFILGWKTRVMSVLLWLLTLAFLTRTHAMRTGAEEVLMVGLLLLMFAPSGYAFSLDQRARRRRDPTLGDAPIYTVAWPLRLLQIQLAMIYFTTGLAKVLAPAWHEGWFVSTWWDGTSLHYVLCKIHMTHWSYAQTQLPFWVTATATYVAVWWEVLFPFLVCSRWTRAATLWFGVLFHIGIYISIEVGWFSFYTLSFYAVWVPGEFWDRWKKKEIRPQAGE